MNLILLVPIRAHTKVLTKMGLMEPSRSIYLPLIGEDKRPLHSQSTAIGHTKAYGARRHRPAATDDVLNVEFPIKSSWKHVRHKIPNLLLSRGWMEECCKFEDGSTKI